MKIDYEYIATFLWENITFEVFIKFLVIYFFIIWISLLIWIIKDISNRTENIFLQILSVLTILLLTPFWFFIYLIIRPSKTLLERYYEEIEENLDIVLQSVESNIKWEETKEEQLLWERMKKIKLDKVKDILGNKETENDILYTHSKPINLDDNICYNCNTPVSYNFKFCPNCKTELKYKCKSCQKTIFTWWKICPYCWEDNHSEKTEKKKKEK